MDEVGGALVAIALTLCAVVIWAPSSFTSPVTIGSEFFKV